MAPFKHKVDTLLGWFHTFGEQCMCMYVCVSWHMKIPFLLLLLHFICNACSSNETQCYHSYQFWLQCYQFALTWVSAWFVLLSFFISILKSYFSQCAITLLLQCLWRILADKSHKIYSQVRVIESIASKYRHFKLKMATVFEKHSSWRYLLHLYLFSMNMLS